MDVTHEKMRQRFSKSEWGLERSILVILYILCLVIQSKCQTVIDESQSTTKRDVDNLDYNVETNNCHSSHSCLSSSIKNEEGKIEEDKISHNDHEENFVDSLLTTIGTVTKDYLLINKTEIQLENEIENIVDDALSKDRYELFDGIEIKAVENLEQSKKENIQVEMRSNEERALFPTYSYEYRLFQKVKNFVDTHILSINLPKAARLIGFRSFGLKKLFLPLLIGAQIFKSVLLAMFLPSILGSFGKILGKGISQLSASSSQASYPPPSVDEQGYTTDNKDFMGYETNPAGSFAYPQDGMYMNVDANDVNDLSNVDMSRFGPGGQKVSYLPSKNGYYKNQMATNNYKVFQKIPASSMILNNYDPFYSPLLSRLDGIFARLGLTPAENTGEETQIGGQSLSDVKLEACREQLICLMYASPAKYAPYSNLISAQLSRELNDLRRPVSDNPEILRFFRYMRAARRGQEGADCMRAFPGCAANAAPAHTMIAAYHDINKLVTARKLH